MGIASFSVGARDANTDMLSSTIRTSGAHTTSESAASFIEDAAGDITLAVGEVISIHASEAMRVRFGGTAATASTGIYIAASTTRDIVCREPGKVSAMDVA